ncbi:dipeptide ABC transporter ATP-binding protein [Rhodobacter sphaeroides]|jgi:ATPase components of various ABC-type transport systems, contain duplicated ATPase|uniref:ABC peptide transporter, fused ATPase domains n=1 Tax=Cereibacter sphaeroides (strain ATCC 17023 / DSM 158 / JCM 6121 / CCUG 31486 / LMG 2827 / NBRC 12203 / NCIMB 8253 / ATH 2.4.1.) TaxID=272943 RepID=Q3IX73_CERS4|nr:ABC transporter ATP-binding protein [Cereibacter sphaeroides]ABA80861.1 ABC peptide transporter, fused ATPase domains [Cereibacter sphaeroides 2.4.1]AMJ49186.1 ABC transporter ATP-binding protein [Cereibacter sphaeroides]ANS35903.1 ABC transporter ATP-binding protein [Cereibacter sphaeroides]ATN64956.1 ABC transporter ATP-binding protein [Cereibacter sphaeroides]AXC63152.1 ABC transporter ATP-binding protein [Cereibacter sphaeroides 2.4.1]
MSGAALLSGAASAPDAEALPALTVEGLEVSVRTEAGLRPLVSGLSFTLARGETLAIAGESGSGKSITSLAIMGLLPPPAVRITGGRVKLGRTELTDLPEGRMRAIRGDRVAMIFQEPMTSLNPVLTIGTQLAEAIRAHETVSKAEARARALEALRSVRLSQPERRLDQYPHELSGGMRQRVMIAMALALRPEVLIADEPTTALDVTVQREVLDLLRDLQRELGTAIILITHDMGVVAEMADRVIVMRDGRMVEEGPATQIFTEPRAEYTRALLAAVPRMGAGRGRPPVEAEPIARLSDLQVRFDLKGGLLGRTQARVHAVEHVSFDIRRGETFALVGESGCGKSTIAKAMVGLVPHEGRIEIGGDRLGALDAAGRKALRRRVQIVFQDPMAALDPRMRIGDLIAEPLVIHGIGTPEERRARVGDLLTRVGLSPAQMERYPHEFSGGQRQRICIARALALRPELIIADESVSALDVSVQARVLDLLAALKREFGIALLFISHDMAVVENVSDRVAVMYLGQIVEMGTRDQVFGNPQHPYTRRLIEAVPVPDPLHQRPPAPRLAGEIPSPVHPVGSGPERVRLTDVGAGHLVAR